MPKWKFIKLTFSIFLFPIFSFSQPPEFTTVSVDHLLVVFNQNDSDQNDDGVPDSQELALYYQDKRNVPESNMLGLDISTSNYYYYHLSGWQSFWDEMVIPIQNKIDELGATWIKYILICDKIPYSLSLGDILDTANNSRSVDNALVTLNYLGSRDFPNFTTYWRTNPVFESTPTQNTDKGQFDHSSMQMMGTNIYLVSKREPITY